jgi:hypothetical protein
MEQLSWQRLALRLVVMPSLYVAALLQSWSMTLTVFATGLMFYMGVMNPGGTHGIQSSQGRNGLATMTGTDRETIREDVLDDIASELLEEKKRRVFH